MPGLLLSEFLPEIFWEEIAEEIIFFHILFWCLTWFTNLGFISNEPTYYLLDYGDFKCYLMAYKNQLIKIYAIWCMKTLNLLIAQFFFPARLMAIFNTSVCSDNFMHLISHLNTVIPY